MRFKTLTVAGAIPFPDETTIAFPVARKVALTGDNGAGKSTVFDCLYAAIYGNVTKPNGLYSLFEGRKDGLIDLTFDMGGREFRIKRLIDGVGRKQKPYLYIDGQPVTEGKVSEFESAIGAALQMSEKAFLASVYNSQTQVGNPLALNDRERRDLLSEVLGLEQFDLPLALASDDLAQVNREADTLRAKRVALLEQVANPGELEARKADIQQQIASLAESIKLNEQQADAARQRLADAKANAQQLDEVNRQITVLTEQLAADKAALEGLDAKIKKNTDQLIGQKDQILGAEKRTAELAEILKTAEDEAQGIDQKMAEWQTDKDTRLKAASDATAAAQVEATTARNLLAETEKAITEKQNQIGAIDNEIKALRPSTDLVDSVPCAGMEINKTCDLLKQAHGNKARITELEAQLPELQQALTDAYTTLAEKQAAYADADRRWKELASAQTAIMAETAPPTWAGTRQKLTTEIAASKAEIEKLKPLIDLRPHLDGAEDRIAGYQQEASVTRIRLESTEKALADWQAKQAAAANLTETITKAEQEIRQLESVRQTASAHRDQFTATLGQIDSQIEQARKAAEQGALIDLEIKSLNSRISLLEFLKEGLGPKGARALKIDSAGPEISELVNTLLRECYGGRFTILIKTLRDLQSGEQREKLEFSIIDNETGKETPVENKSGGEQQLIKEVISLGLCIYQRRRAGVDTRTIIRDEACSALTEENTVRYVQMLDRAAEIGQFDQVLYVSHKGCAQQLADAVILIEKGGKAKVITG